MSEKLTPPTRPGEWSINQIIAALSRPIPPGILKTLKDKGNCQYIPWHRANEILNKYAPGWSWKIEDVQLSSDRIFLQGGLTIVASDITTTRYAGATELLKQRRWDKNLKEYVIQELAYGDPMSNAESKAFRRCAARFGLGLYLYGDDDESPILPFLETATQKIVQSGDGEVVQDTRYASQKQIAMLFAVGKGRNLDSELVKAIADAMGYSSMKDIPATEVDRVKAEIEQYSIDKSPKIWQTWKTEKDAIDWAKKQLPNIKPEQIRQEWSKITPVTLSNNKPSKAIPWVERIQQLKTISSELSTVRN